MHLCHVVHIFPAVEVNPDGMEEERNHLNRSPSIQLFEGLMYYCELYSTFIIYRRCLNRPLEVPTSTARRTRQPHHASMPERTRSKRHDASLVHSPRMRRGPCESTNITSAFLWADRQSSSPGLCLPCRSEMSETVFIASRMISSAGQLAQPPRQTASECQATAATGTRRPPATT